MCCDQPVSAYLSAGDHELGTQDSSLERRTQIQPDAAEIEFDILSGKECLYAICDHADIGTRRAFGIGKEARSLIDC
jgi:hypothetical protein